MSSDPPLGPRVLGATETRAALPFGPLIAALRTAFAAGGDVPERHHHALPGGATLLLMPAWDERLLGTKLVTVHPANPAHGLPAVHSLYLLASAETGQPLVLLDGGELTARRTAAVSALAGSYLAPPGPLRMLLVGAGRVGSLLPRAWREVRALSEVAVWNPTPAHAERLAAELAAEGLPTRPAGLLADEVAAADLVSCATLAAEPLIRGAWLRPETHLDLVGSFRPTMREADEQAVEQAEVWVDSRAALAEAGELAALASGDVAGTLADLCRGAAVRTPGKRSTLFKSVGTALADLAAARLAHQSSSSPTAPEPPFSVTGT